MGCLILGDGLAVGIAAALNALGAPKCTSTATQNVSTREIAAAAPTGHIDVAVISRGSNDAGARELPAQLERLRERIDARRLIWVLPYNRSAAAIVRSTAVEFGDNWIDPSILPSADRIHPLTYASLARALIPLLAYSPVGRPSGHERREAQSSWMISPGARSILVFR